MEYFFRTEKLGVGYNGTPVVTDIEVSVKKGQILALIGPNGSGKSTILKSIARQIKTVAGAIYIEEKSIKNIGKQEMARQAAVVLTERPKPELMTCEDVVAAGRYPYTGLLGILSENDRDKIRNALLAVGAYDLKDRNYTEISDGQLQRIMLARAICQEPEIILLDEPTSFLDIRYAVDILDILRDMAKKRGVTVVLSLHELNYAKRVSDLVMCVKSGRVVCVGDPAEIFTKDIVSGLYDLPEGYYEQLFGGL